MLTSQRRTATASADTDCILFFMTTSAFDTVIRDFPMYYDAILNKAMERLEKTLRSNASLEVRMRQLGLRQAILQQRAAKLGAEQGPSRWEEVEGESGRKGSQTTGIAIAKGWGALRKVVNLNPPKEAESDAPSESSSFQKKPARRRSNWSKKKLGRNSDGRLAVIELERDMAEADADAAAVANAKKMSVESPITQLSFRGASMVRSSTGRWKAKAAIPAAAAAKGVESPPDGLNARGLALGGPGPTLGPVARSPPSPTPLSGGAEQAVYSYSPPSYMTYR